MTDVCLQSSGILNRPAYREYVDNIRVRDLTAKAPIDPDAPLQDDHGDTHTVSGLSLGKTSTLVLEGMPDSLTRIQSRRMEAKLAKRTNALQRLTVE